MVWGKVGPHGQAVQDTGWSTSPRLLLLGAAVIASNAATQPRKPQRHGSGSASFPKEYSFVSW